jgi:2-dehydro-3-deoxygluconokinase
MTGDAVAIGECMVELSLEGERRAVLGYAGDTFNAAVYLSRLGVRTAYGTALGAGDPFSDGILEAMRAEGVASDLVVAAPGRLPGLYVITRDARGERSFFYWRDQSPARDYLRLADVRALAQTLGQARLVYVSAITLAILGASGRIRLKALLADAGRAGAGIAFDTNYRPRLWRSAKAARTAVESFAPLSRWISAGAADLAGMGAEPAETARRWAGRGAEVVLRHEDRAIEVRSGEDLQSFGPEPEVAVVDTTGAGDAFNAAYLASRLAGRDAAASVAAGRRLAAVVVQHKGAIIPREAVPPELIGG